jgi:hypothetical protein
MNAQSIEVALDGPASEHTQIRRRAEYPRLGVDALQYHLFKPRMSHHPLLLSAYELWRNGWQATLGELEGVRRIHSDEFGRQDEIGVLSVGQRCISVTGLRWFDLSLAMAREDSYFLPWPKDTLDSLGDCIVGVPSNLVVHPEWRGTVVEAANDRPEDDISLALATLALAIRRFIDSPAERFVGMARNDRAMNRVAASIGGTKLGLITMHGVESDLICITRANATPQGPVVDTLWERRCQE